MSAGEPSTTTPSVDVRLAPDASDRALRDDVARGLGSAPKTLSPKWFYDEVGSELFDKITRLPEYYPTEAERTILRSRSGAIAEQTGASTLVELGSGTSDKTRVLLDALWGKGSLRRYVPFDVSEAPLRQASEALVREYPGLEVRGVVGDFDHHIRDLPLADGPALCALLGSTIGNYAPSERRVLLDAIEHALRPGDWFLLGTDLVKETSRLVAAYDDAAGVTAAFNRNVLRVLNRELAADFDIDEFEHEARFDDQNEWIEMHLVSRSAQRVQIAALGLELAFDPGESIRTEISAKFRRESLAAELAAVGLNLVAWWTDPPGDFALSLSRRL